MHSETREAMIPETTAAVAPTVVAVAAEEAGPGAGA